VLEERDGGRTWAESVAGHMERRYSPGRTWESLVRGIVGLARLGDVVDVASGDGVLAELLAGRARSITCLDASARVVAAGSRRTGRLATVRFVRGDMHALPFTAERFDEALLMNALCFARKPARVLAEIARVLRPGGRLIAVTLNRHEHEAAVEPFGHRMLGFEPGRLRRMLARAGFDTECCEVTSRERRAPHFEAITVHARRKEIAR
jgi:ArsR family transcriptional regulator